MTYTVKRGDSLSKIAQKYGISWKDLWNANKSIIGNNPDLIYSGQKYTIPGQSPAPKAKPKTTLKTEARQLAESVAPKMTPFGDILGFSEYFDPNLARSSAEQIAAAYYVPQAERGRRNIETDFAGRGLTRSGMRGTNIGDLYGEIGQQQQASAETDINEMRQQAQQEYSKLQELYEQSEGKERPISKTYEAYGYTPPRTSAGRYGTTYLNWLNNILNK